MLVAACAAPDVAPPSAPVIASGPVPDDAPTAPVEAVAPDAPPIVPAPVIAATDEVWLRGSTHVHARPSGDSSEPIKDVLRWYQARGYDFIVLTDHNKVSEVAGDTTGQVAVATEPLIVLAGSELTHNPSGCLPAGDRSKKCRIHVNAIGPTARPVGKLDWPNRKTHDRVAKYQSAIDQAHALGTTLVQVNHPQWYWGMTGELLAELARRGIHLVEIANIQFPTWNAGDQGHPSMEAIWDSALATGATLWGVASDDAHSYHGSKHDPWPAGGGWIVVHARRDPQALVDAIAAGHFYASTGVELARAEATNGELHVDVAASDPGQDRIAFVENGKTVETVEGKSAHRALPASGYLRAVVTRDDGKQAWVQPARR